MLSSSVTCCPPSSKNLHETWNCQGSWYLDSSMTKKSKVENILAQHFLTFGPTHTDCHIHFKFEKLCFHTSVFHQSFGKRSGCRNFIDIAGMPYISQRQREHGESANQCLICTVVFFDWSSHAILRVSLAHFVPSCIITSDLYI